ncbi:MAG TPA: hypothetical protein VKM55_16085 [Candidatus Lokiarchaeia archaeon]|nr:hypothetical protein [Candidatus Lokiarchaeia archaeon]
MNVAIHFIDQKVMVSMEMPVDVAEMTVDDFLVWAFENIEDQHVRDVLVAIREGHVKWFKYTRSHDASGALHDLDGLKKKILSLVVPRREKSTRIAGDIFFSAPYAFPCYRCGACCMPKKSDQGFREFLGDLPPDDNTYYVKINGMPCKVKPPPGIDVLDLGIPARCAHLIFDTTEGLYGCKIHDKPRGYACTHYECSSMHDEPDRWEGTFTKVPSHPTCNSCQERTCSTCFYLPIRVEWFIAYIRHHDAKAINAGFLDDVISELEEYMKKLQTNDDEALSACINNDWLEEYLVSLKDVKKIIESVKTS